MSGEIPSYARYIFLLGCIVSLIFGAWFFISPESWSDITGWPPEPSTARVLGAILLSYVLGAFLAFRAESWKEIEIYVLMSIIWTLLGTIGMVWNMAVMTLPIASLLTTGLLVMFLILYLYLYMQLRRS
ncbi:MAG: hypothetical protein ACFFE6_11400 [Candidatus Thorarchaeota archaeon]